MSREMFMEKLEYLLSDIESEEKNEALAYYRDYLEEAGDEREQDVLEEFGSPERIAAIVRADLYGHMKDGGDFTETGFQDERFTQPGYQVIQRLDLPDETKSSQGQQMRGKNRPNDTITGGWSRLMKWAVLAVLLLLALPLGISVGSGFLGAAVGVAAGVIGLLLLAGVLTVAILLGGVAVFISGLLCLLANIPFGILITGVGLSIFGVGILCLGVTIVLYGKFVPFCIRGAVNLVSGLFHRERRRV